MAIDPSIALSYRSPQIDSPATVAAQTAALRNSSIQAASGIERLRTEQMANEETALKHRDDQIATQTFLQAGGDPEKHVRLMAEAGARPQAVQALQQHYGAIAEQKAKTSKDQADADKYSNDRLAAITRQALDTPDEQLASAWPQYKQAALAVNPKLQLPDDPPTKEQLQHINALFQTNESLDKKAAEIRAAAEAKQKETAATDTHTREQAGLPKVQAEAAAAVRQQDAAALATAAKSGQLGPALAQLPPERRAAFSTLPANAKPEDILPLGMTPDQQVTTAGQAQTRAEQAHHNAIEEGQGAQRVTISRQEQALRQKTFDATYGSLVDPNSGKPLEPEAAKAVASQDPLAVAVANYQAAPPPTGRGGPGASIMRKVLAINPDYNAQNWQAQGAVLRDFTSGNTSKSLIKMNTALGHLGELNEAADALKNGDVRILNAIANRLGAETGKDAATTFQTIVHRVGPEIEGAYVGAAGSAGERETTAKDFDPSLGAQQIKSNIAESAKLFRSKIAAEEYRWKQVMPNRSMPFLLTPAAEQTMKSITGAGSGGQGAAPKEGDTRQYAGRTYTFHGDVWVGK